MELTTAGWILAGLVAFMSGLSKTGVSGLGILGVVLLAVAVPSARQSVGMILPMLIVADVFAISIYRRHASWSHLLRLFPWVAVGLAGGLVALWRIKQNSVFSPILGGIVLAMLAVHAARTWALRRNGGNTPSPLPVHDVSPARGEGVATDDSPSPPPRPSFIQGQGLRPNGAAAFLVNVPQAGWFTVVAGLLAGFATGMSNAAGPVMSVYILAMGMDKRQFMGTAAWFFFIVNVAKAPWMALMGLIDQKTLIFNAKLTPLIILGALLGPFILKVLPQKTFEWVVFALAAVGAVQLVIGQFLFPAHVGLV